MTLGVGREKALDKEKSWVKDHLPPPRDMQEPSSQSFPLKKSQALTFTMGRSTPHEGEVVWVAKTH